MDQTARPRRATGVLVAVTTLAASLLLPPAAAAAAGPPAPPALVGPADGATGVPAGARLSVTVDDPDGGPLDVRFQGRPTGGGAANPATDFTLGLIPDTQNYVSAAANRAIMGAQTQWLADNRAALNLKFVSHLGDIVGVSTSQTQWQAASQYMATLDAAGVPNTVLPGNHDMDVPTGAAPEYLQHFPASRYAAASWNSPTASYGGYLGQNLFGPDPVDRGNMDSFALLSAGGMDFLLLNLEFDPPDVVIDWAKKVLAAYPQRRAILVTHSYVNTSGQIASNVQRPGGNTGAQLWQKLVSPSCSIFLVVNGHFHNGDLSEARRTDTNSCGRPVHAVLSDYQERINGGDGWLRYYVFAPAANEIRAVTYSPTLGRYETDADSAFTLPYDMTLPSAAFPEIGRATTDSGGTASIPVPTLPAGTDYEWRVTVGDDVSTVTGPTWSFRTASAPPPAVLAADAFGRTVAGGWGAADTGGAWQLSGAAARASVSGGAGVQGVPAGTTTTASLSGVAATGTDLTLSLGPDTVPNGAAYVWAAARRVGTGEYSARVKVNPTGTVELHTIRSGTTLAGGARPGLTLAAGQRLRIRVQAEGVSPTTVRARVWPADTAEPSTWQVSSTDSTPGLQVAGTVGLSSYLSSAATNGPVTWRFDDLRATPTGAAPEPANQPPTAAFSTSTAGLTVSADGSGSVDPDGTVTGHAWSFGDGATATGRTVSHSYAAAGTYPVTLTVTDDDGATATRTASVTVTAAPVPVPTALAADAYGRSVTGGWGSADTGGAWALGGGATRFSVAGGAGLTVVPSGVTTVATLPVSSAATDLRVALGLDAIPNGPLYATVTGRKVGSAEYGARVKVLAGGAVELAVVRSGTVVSGGALPGVTLAAGQQLLVRVQVQGTSPTTVRTRAWKAGTAEPTTWARTVTDATAGLQAAGSIALTTYLSSSATTGALTVRYDDLAATRL